MVFQNGALYQTNFIKFEVRKGIPLPHKIILLLLRKDKRKWQFITFQLKRSVEQMGEVP